MAAPWQLHAAVSLRCHGTESLAGAAGGGRGAGWTTWRCAARAAKLASASAPLLGGISVRKPEGEPTNVKGITPVQAIRVTCVGLEDVIADTACHSAMKAVGAWAEYGNVEVGGSAGEARDKGSGAVSRVCATSRVLDGVGGVPLRVHDGGQCPVF